MRRGREEEEKEDLVCHNHDSHWDIESIENEDGRRRRHVRLISNEGAQKLLFALETTGGSAKQVWITWRD
jgi:hypothetical protein